ncbi:hypothetical protein V6N11_054818 [Hibiscus sabdariffa]|uniref:Uncharacterized protein n=1 Tax=Hibiscus sabdariffa TaxID=183260 RepID=A0ABR2S5X0_9ROSI
MEPCIGKEMTGKTDHFVQFEKDEIHSVQIGKKIYGAFMNVVKRDDERVNVSATQVELQVVRAKVATFESEVMLDEKNEALKYERVKCSTRGKFFDVEILQLRFTEVEAEKLPREALKGFMPSQILEIDVSRS